MEKIFVNFSNHPSGSWAREQTDAALLLCHGGKVVDIPFPMVSPQLDEVDIMDLTDEYLEKIISCEPAAVMVQGEFGLTYAMVTQLKSKGIPVVYACSERKVKETQIKGGNYKKEVSFEFIRFREYR